MEVSARLYPTGPRRHPETCSGPGQGAGCNGVMAALIAELPELVPGLLTPAYRATLRGAQIPESWHEGITWLMHRGKAMGDLDAYCSMELGQQDTHVNVHDPSHAKVHRSLGPKGGGGRLAVRGHAGLHSSGTSLPRAARATACSEGKPCPSLRRVTALPHHSAWGIGPSPTPHGCPGGTY